MKNFSLQNQTRNVSITLLVACMAAAGCGKSSGSDANGDNDKPAMAAAKDTPIGKDTTKQTPDGVTPKAPDAKVPAAPDKSTPALAGDKNQNPGAGQDQPTPPVDVAKDKPATNPTTSPNLTGNGTPDQGKPTTTTTTTTTPGKGDQQQQQQQPVPTVPPQGQAEQTQQDVPFLAIVHALNAGEIQINQLAATRLKSEGFKHFTAMLIKDHSDADAKALALAKDLGADLATAPVTPGVKAEQDAAQQAMAKLTAASDTEFDAAYIRIMQESHDRAITFVQAQLTNLRDQRLVTFANELLAKLSEHKAQLRSALD